MFFCFVGGDKLNGGNNVVRGVELNFWTYAHMQGRGDSEKDEHRREIERGK